jgi:hypothetical protein
VDVKANHTRPNRQSLSPLMPDDNDPLRPLMARYPADFSPPKSRTVPSVLHTTKLPTSNVYLDQALAGSIIGVSPWERPTEWASADSEYVNSIVGEISELTGNVDVGLIGFANRFIIYQVSNGDPSAVHT